VRPRGTLPKTVECSSGWGAGPTVPKLSPSVRAPVYVGAYSLCQSDNIGRDALGLLPRRRVPESVRRRPLSSPSSTVACAASDEQDDDDDDDDDGDGSDANVAGGHGRLRRVGAPGSPKGRPGSRTPTGCCYSFRRSLDRFRVVRVPGAGGVIPARDRPRGAFRLTRSDRARPSHVPLSRGRPDTIASTSSRGAVAASSSTRRPGGPRSDRRGVPRRAGERVDGRSAARASSCWPSTSSERNARVCC
jgi:hypothetical protein